MPTAYPVKITAHYATCCFCDKPALNDAPAFSTEPRFNFRAEAAKYAHQRGLTDLVFSKYKSALASLAHPCSHRPQQTVRIEWTIDYSTPAAALAALPPSRDSHHNNA